MKREIIGIAVIVGCACSMVVRGEEEVRARHILFAPQEEKLARKILEEIKAGDRTFEKACEDYSIDRATKRCGGDLNYFTRRHRFAPPLKNAAFKLKKGEYAPEPIKTF